MGYTPAGRIELAPDWRGTAEELAEKVTLFLFQCGFDGQFGCSERLVRFYVTRGVLTPPEKDAVDRRKALFGPLQFRQLAVARLLAERGWDLDRVIGQVQGIDGPKDLRELDALLNQLGEPTQSERLLFESRQNQMESRIEEVSHSAGSAPRERGEAAGKTPSESDRLARRILSTARETGGLERLTTLTNKLLRDPAASPEERETLRQLGEMARHAANQPGKRERWTRIKLAPWCEVNLRVGKYSEPTEKEKMLIMKEMHQILENYDSRD